MIPQAITDVGPYSDLWSHLKSMQHALHRATVAKTSKDLVNLDREKLEALARFLRQELTHKPDPDTINFAAFRQTTGMPAFFLDIDFSEMLRKLSKFENWQAQQKMGFDKKWQKLVGILEEYTTQLGKSLLPCALPKEEFEILDTVISELLIHTESSFNV